MVGKMLSHYRLVEKIGEGGMGVVWKAEDTVLGRTVAIKVLPADVALDEERRQLFLNEARLAASLSHAHIVQVHDLGHEGDLDFIVMEYVEGRPLSRLLHGHALPPEKVASLGLQIAEGLSRAHHKKLLHRDLKPANVLVTPEGEAKIVDFGLATLFEGLESMLASSTVPLADAAASDEEASVVGTLPYMSPEQVRVERLDARSDIFSFGTMLYEMTTGRRPFQGSTPAEVAREVLRDQPTPVQELAPKVPLDLLRIIEKAMARKPEDRYQTLDDAAVDLRRLAKEIESGSWPSYADLQPTRSASRTWARRIWVLGGMGVAAAALLAWFAVSRRGGELAPTSAPAKVASLPDRSAIAVLPFQNLTAEEPQAYFAGGLHDELLTQLAKVAALKVISRTSVMGYQGTYMPPLKQIAKELGVGSVVEGSVQVVGERLRVNVQLIDAATDEHLWAERYDRTLDDAFAIQSDVAQQIVAAVGSALAAGEREAIALAPTKNPEAYRLYLQGEEYRRRPAAMQEHLTSAQQLYERATALDPGFALAHARLSEVHGSMFWTMYDTSPARLARQREEAEMALRLAPQLPQAHIAMGQAYYGGRMDYRRALQEFRVALRSIPNDGELWARVGYVHRRLGEWAAVDSAYRCATRLDPRNADIFLDLGGSTFYRTRRYAEAVQAYDRALELAPDLRSAALRKAWVFVFWKGDLGPIKAMLDSLPEDAILGSDGTADQQRADLLLIERKPAELLALVGRHRDSGFSGQVLSTWDAYAGWAHRMRGDESAARTAFTSALAALDSLSDAGPEGWAVHADRGRALAALGRREDALREVEWLEHCEVFRNDAWLAPGLTANCALILAQLGEADAALDRIERQFSEPVGMSIHSLRLGPNWDPIRDHPRFKALLAKYAET